MNTQSVSFLSMISMHSKTVATAGAGFISHLPDRTFHATVYLHLHTCTPFLQRGRIASNAERCNTYSNSVCPSVCLSVCHTLVPYPDE